MQPRRSSQTYFEFQAPRAPISNTKSESDQPRTPPQIAPKARVVDTSPDLFGYVAPAKPTLDPSTFRRTVGVDCLDYAMLRDIGGWTADEIVPAATEAERIKQLQRLSLEAYGRNPAAMVAKCTGGLASARQSFARDNASHSRYAEYVADYLYTPTNAEGGLVTPRLASWDPARGSIFTFVKGIERGARTEYLRELQAARVTSIEELAESGQQIAQRPWVDGPGHKRRDYDLGFAGDRQIAVKRDASHLLRALGKDPSEVFARDTEKTRSMWLAWLRRVDPDKDHEKAVHSANPNSQRFDECWPEAAIQLEDLEETDLATYQRFSPMLRSPIERYADIARESAIDLARRLHPEADTTLVETWSPASRRLSEAHPDLYRSARDIGEIGQSALVLSPEEMHRQRHVWRLREDPESLRDLSGSRPDLLFLREAAGVDREPPSGPKAAKDFWRGLALERTSAAIEAADDENTRELLEDVLTRQLGTEDRPGWDPEMETYQDCIRRHRDALLEERAALSRELAHETDRTSAYEAADATEETY